MSMLQITRIVGPFRGDGYPTTFQTELDLFVFALVWPHLFFSLFFFFKVILLFLYGCLYSILF